MLAVGDFEPAVESLLVEVGARQFDGRGSEIDPAADGAAASEPREVDARAAADVENRSAAIAVKVHEPKQMMELFEMILIEVVEKPTGADGMVRDLQIVNVPVPVLAHVFGRRHGPHYNRIRMWPR